MHHKEFVKLYNKREKKGETAYENYKCHIFIKINLVPFIKRNMKIVISFLKYYSIDCTLLTHKANFFSPL